MEIRNRIFEKYSEHEIGIPLKDEDRVLVRQGKISVGKEFLHRFVSTLKKTINLPKVLHCKKTECERFVAKIDGEYVDRGEIIAKKTSKGGLTVTEIKSPITGILDLTRLEYGYIDILGEEKETVLESNFEAEVLGIDPMEGLVIKSNLVAIDAVVTSQRKGKVLGRLDILGDGKSILKEDILEDDYSERIVWVGPYLYSSLAVELFERGAVGVITYATSYKQFRDMGLPVVVLGGFGSVHCDNQFLKTFLSLKDSYALIDNEENQIFVLKDINFKNNNWFIESYIGQKIISRATSTYGYIGEVSDFEEESKSLIIDFPKKGSAVINIGLVDFIDL